MGQKVAILSFKKPFRALEFSQYINFKNNSFFILKDYYIRRILQQYLKKKKFVLNTCQISQSLNKIQILLNFYPKKDLLFPAIKRSMIAYWINRSKNFKKKYSIARRNRKLKPYKKFLLKKFVVDIPYLKKEAKKRQIDIDFFPKHAKVAQDHLFPSTRKVLVRNLKKKHQLKKKNFYLNKKFIFTKHNLYKKIKKIIFFNNFNFFNLYKLKIFFKYFYKNFKILKLNYLLYNLIKESTHFNFKPVLELKKSKYNLRKKTRRKNRIRRIWIDRIRYRTRKKIKRTIYYKKIKGRRLRIKIKQLRMKQFIKDYTYNSYNFFKFLKRYRKRYFRKIFRRRNKKLKNFIIIIRRYRVKILKLLSSIKSLNLKKINNEQFNSKKYLLFLYKINHYKKFQLMKILLKKIKFLITCLKKFKLILLNEYDNFSNLNYLNLKIIAQLKTTIKYYYLLQNFTTVNNSLYKAK